MQYSKGPNKGSLLSPFLQNKALNFINSSLCKLGQDSISLIQRNKTLQKEINKLEHLNIKKDHKIKQLVGSLSQYKRKRSKYISRIRAVASRKSLSSSQSLKASILTQLMKNKRQYTTQFINMTTRLSQINQISFRSTIQAAQIIMGFLTGEDLSLSLTRQSVVKWNQEISELYISQILNQQISLPLE
ncbi:hypothetical protein C2G38_2045009 [Gigaspora rosea]|uniref:Uncharacterized protein n=1 Tax=Gigaspora rosea TaxID=44941 RepID=A0A397UEN3_9GLOM|nr:hypothetical protein C2G38_2045009 [Gigaspora rosea]